MRRGFSLVELSIVLVILGLLTGGILAGQSLIRAAELRSISRDYQRYVSATHTFRDKYMAIPGDMLRATQFWGTAGTCPGTNATPSTTIATCNGDGNGMLDRTVTTSNEYFRFWQHLANAGLIEGSYSGVADSATASDRTTRLNFNVPSGKISNSVWAVEYVGSPAPISSVNWMEGNYGNILNVAQPPTAYGDTLRPDEAWGIDSKLDDGRPGLGKIRVPESDSNCIDQAASAVVALAGIANYILTSSEIACTLVFVDLF